MAFLKSFNAACDLNKYLFCKMPEGTLEVEVKVKTTWGKFTMVQNTHTRMEKYHTWEKAQRCHIKSKKGRTPHKAASVHTDDNTSETDMPALIHSSYFTFIHTIINMFIQLQEGSKVQKIYCSLIEEGVNHRKEVRIHLL